MWDRPCNRAKKKQSKNGLHKKAETHASRHTQRTRHTQRNIKEQRKNEIKANIELIGNLSDQRVPFSLTDFKQNPNGLPVEPGRPDRDANK